MPSAKLRSAKLPGFLCLWCDVVGNRTPASRTPSGRSNHCATQGRSINSKRCLSCLLEATGRQSTVRHSSSLQKPAFPLEGRPLPPRPQVPTSLIRTRQTSVLFACISSSTVSSVMFAVSKTTKTELYKSQKVNVHL